MLSQKAAIVVADLVICLAWLAVLARLHRSRRRKGSVERRNSCSFSRQDARSQLGVSLLGCEGVLRERSSATNENERMPR